MGLVIYHFTPFSTEFLGPKSIGIQDHHHPYGGVVGLSPLTKGLKLRYFGRMEMKCVGFRPWLLVSCSAGSGARQPPG